MKVKTISMDDLGPKNEKEAVIFAEEKFVVDCQYLINFSMKSGIFRDKLKERLGRRFMKRIFETGNISIRDLAAIFHILGKECRIVIDE